MNSNETTFILSEDIRYRRVLDEAVVVRQQTNEVIVLNEVSASILEFFENQGNATVSRLIDYLADEYEIDIKSLQRDTPTHIKELINAGIIIVAE